MKPQPCCCTTLSSCGKKSITSRHNGRKSRFFVVNIGNLTGRIIAVLTFNGPFYLGIFKTVSLLVPELDILSGYKTAPALSLKQRNVLRLETNLH